METFCLVRPEHLNHHGNLFGGQMLKWVDEYGWLAATRDYPQQILVTRAMDSVEFKNRVGSGSILRFNIDQISRGSSSLTYKVEVFTTGPGCKNEILVFSTHVTFVCVDGAGNRKTIEGGSVENG